MPGIFSFDNPAFVNRNEAFRFGRRRLHFDLPFRSMNIQPCVQCMVAILVVTKDHFQSWQRLHRNSRQLFRCGGTIIHIGRRDNDRDQQTQRSHQQMSLQAFDFLCTIVAPLFTTSLRCLHRLGVDTASTRRRFASFTHTNSHSQFVQNFLQRAIITPCRKVLPRRTFRE